MDQRDENKKVWGRKNFSWAIPIGLNICTILCLNFWSCSHSNLLQQTSLIGKSPASVKDTPRGNIQILLKDFFSLSKEVDQGLKNHIQFTKTWKDTLQPFYEKRKFFSLWTVGVTSLNDKAQNFLNIIEKVNENGLHAKDYDYTIIKQFYEILQNAKIQQQLVLVERTLQNLEILLTCSFLKYAKDLFQGKVDPASIDTLWSAHLRKFQPTAILQRLQEDSPQKILEDLFPPHPGALRLKNQLSNYRMIQPFTDHLIIPKGKLPLAIGQKDPRVPLLRKKLSLLRDSGPLKEGADSEIFDAHLVTALKKFQKRHGLEATGSVDKKTLFNLNVSLKKRIQQLEINLERWRWLPSSFGEKYIVVNIANFTLSIIEDKKITANMKVIVGKRYRKTPVFSSGIDSLTLHPHWTIPHNIFMENILPELKKNPNYLSQHKIQVFTTEQGKLVEIEKPKISWNEISTTTPFPYVLKQVPGPKNPLGKIIFHLPNKYLVYLHDTPSQHFFSINNRTLSAGCIRVERPLDLAEFILKHSGSTWGRHDLEELIKKGVNKKIILPNPVPVHVLYWTAWVSKKGIVHFREDIYGRDARLAKKLY